MRYRHDHILPDKTKYTEEKDIDSAQETGILHMASQPGQHKYTILAIKDAHYDFDQKLLQSSTGLFSVEQEVFGKPTAGFHASSRFSYCVGQTFKASRENTATIEFVGQGPFEVDLEVGPPGGGRPLYKKTITNIKGNSWKVDLPDHTFSHVGPQLLQITSVRDSSGCPAEILNDDSLYLGIDVLETASITPVSEREDYCVGDMLEFVLGGKSRLRLSTGPVLTECLLQERRRGMLRRSNYMPGSKMPELMSLFSSQVQIRQEDAPSCREQASVLPFSGKSRRTGNQIGFKQEQQGSYLTGTGLAVMTDREPTPASQCSTSVEDIHRKIHPLPKAKIEEGKPWLQEGMARIRQAKS